MKRISVVAVIIVVIAAIIGGAVLFLGTGVISGGGLGVEEIGIGAIIPLTGPFA